MYKKFLLSIALAGCVLLLQLVLQSVADNYAPLTLFLAPIVVATWLGGASVGVFTLILGVLFEAFFFMQPTYLLAPVSKQDLVRIIIFIAEGLTAILLVTRSRFSRLNFLDLIEKEKQWRRIMFDSILDRSRSEISNRQYLNLLKADSYSLKLAKDKAESANEAKTAFLATMSHEIRNPLGAIVGFSDLLLDNSASAAEVQSYIEKIRRNSELLLHIVDDVLDLSRVEAGKVQVETIKSSYAALLNDVKASFELRAEKQGVALNVHCEDFYAEFIECDPTKLRQICLNIVGNALKFTERGSVDVKFSIHPENDRTATLSCLVKDTGIGMSQEQQCRIFKTFTQADSSTSKRFGGSGLGLVLSRKLCEALGGRLELVESVEGQGSTFLAEVKVGLVHGSNDNTLDHYYGEPQVRMAQKSTCSEKTHVLVVEDAEDNQMLIGRMLESAGATVEFASNGYEGVNKALQGHFDLVLMDIQMPGMNGVDAAKILRKKNFRTPIIALTGHAIQNEDHVARDAGFNDYLTKPVNLQGLIKAVNSIRRLHIDSSQASQA